MVTYFHLPLVTDNSWEYIVILLLILYFSYQKLFGYATEWEELRQFIRLRLVEYPYFDYNATIFEEFLEEEQDHTQPLRKDGRPFAKEQDKAMYAFHPHGVLSSGFIINGAHSCRFQASKIKWLVAENLFWLPFARDLLRWTGFSDVSKETFHQLMSESRNIALIPGGFQEATIYQKGEHRAYIKQRYGFIKMALQYGYKIYPVYTFGEEETYWTFPYFLKTRLRLNDYHIPGVLFQGVWWCFFLPFSTTKLVTIVGKPIQLPLLQEPTKEQVQKYHSLYLETLQNLFDRNKTKYAVNPNATLHLY
jgi:2-acylglycerol O-acyltransferase 2